MPFLSGILNIKYKDGRTLKIKYCKDCGKEETTYKKDLKKDLGKIFRRLGKIEREIVKREAICSERHKK